ncbi:hypothetical protein [Hydrogenophaga sp. NFH-34]|uniref:hypothetical protein n=1 Tax=Hydrogenophaga sp. NFH-34 TaxID=2744446 RepID=UPI001F267919|nr:hypothetical protein [Hydrogenophaga sp. NFH-34]
MRRLALALCLTASSLLTGCDLLGIETAPQIAARKEAEGKAIGSACRHAVRSIEDCFRTNPRAGKAAVFAGWREMDQYMRDNQVVGMPWSENAGSPADRAASEAADPAHGSSHDGGSGVAPRSGSTQRS